MNRRGMTLVELMIALILCGIVAFIVIEMISGEHANYTKTREKIKLQTDAREAMRLMEEEIKNLGYRYKMDINSSKDMTSSACSEVLYPSTQSAFKTPEAQKIEYRFYNPMNQASFDCQNDLWTIGYALESGTLKRSTKYGKGDIITVPFLENVQSFKVSYGIYVDNTVIFSGNDLTDASDIISTATTQTININNANKPFSITNWPNTNTVVRLSKAFKVDTNSTYRIAFAADASADFLDAVLGYENLAVGLFFLDGTPIDASNLITFKPGKVGTARNIQFDFSPTLTPTNATNDVYIGFQAKMRQSISSATKSLNISNLTLTQLNEGIYKNEWIDETHTITDDWKRVKAVRVQLVAKSKKQEEITLDRIIPVVNNED